MKWIDIKKELPTPIPEWYLLTHDCAGGTSVLVYGYDAINFYPRYEVMDINAVASIKSQYTLNGLMITHWLKIERPI